MTKHKDPIKNSIQLVSLHIPKTAGTSFRNILKDVYGGKQVARLDIRKDIELNGSIFDGKQLNNNIQVVHGHFHYDELAEKFLIQKNTPVITWLREPGERVISNYFYLDGILRSKLHHNKKSLNILSRMQKSLLEYAALETNRNRMSKFLRGIKPEEIFFIGLTSHYEEDLGHLARLLGWNDYTLLKQNITGKKPDVDQETIEKIKELNKEDYILYDQALKMRKERMNSIK